MAKHPAIQPITASKKLAICLYSAPGVGKTRLLGTQPKTLILRPPTDHTDSIEDPNNVEEWIVRDHAAMQEAFEMFQQGGGKEFDWVWLDSISLFQDHSLDDIWEDVVAKKPSRAEYGLDQGEYGRNMERLQRWVRNMVGLASNGVMNFGVTAHPAEMYDPVTEKSVYMPWVQGKNMSPKICGYMNIVAYYRLVEREGKPDRRVLHTRATERFYAKDQFDAFKDGRMIDPTMPKITRAIAASRKGKGGSRRTTTRRKRRR